MATLTRLTNLVVLTFQLAGAAVDQFLEQLETALRQLGCRHPRWDVHPDGSATCTAGCGRQLQVCEPEDAEQLLYELHGEVGPGDDGEYCTGRPPADPGEQRVFISKQVGQQ